MVYCISKPSCICCDYAMCEGCSTKSKRAATTYPIVAALIIQSPHIATSAAIGCWRLRSAATVGRRTLQRCYASISRMPEHRHGSLHWASLGTNRLWPQLMSTDEHFVTCGSFSHERSADSCCAAVSAPDSSCAIWPSVSSETEAASVSAPPCKHADLTPEERQH